MYFRVAREDAERFSKESANIVAEIEAQTETGLLQEAEKPKLTLQELWEKAYHSMSRLPLHRSVLHLNRAYGDYSRRALTAILFHLHESLVAAGTLEGFHYRTAESIVRLDDDTFIGLLGQAVMKLEEPRRGALGKALEAILKLRPIEIHIFEDSELVNLNETKASGTEVTGFCPSESLVVDASSGVTLGYRVFGQEYETYVQAISDPQVLKLTGLTTALDFAGMPIGRPFAVCWS